MIYDRSESQSSGILIELKTLVYIMYIIGRIEYSINAPFDFLVLHSNIILLFLGSNLLRFDNGRCG